MVYRDNNHKNQSLYMKKIRRRESDIRRHKNITAKLKDGDLKIHRNLLAKVQATMNHFSNKECVYVFHRFLIVYKWTTEEILGRN